jgi:hypothetical protein
LSDKATSERQGTLDLSPHAGERIRMEREAESGVHQLCWRDADGLEGGHSSLEAVRLLLGNDPYQALDRRWLTVDSQDAPASAQQFERLGAIPGAEIDR